jgi:hypothetical protein
LYTSGPTDTFSFQKASLTMGNVVNASTKNKKMSRPRLLSRNVPSREKKLSICGRLLTRDRPRVMRRNTSSTTPNTLRPTKPENNATLMSVRFWL